MNFNGSKTKVFVALSGGVDSAVTTALLKEREFDVSCVFIKIWQPEFLDCTWKEDRLDAMRVASALEVPFFEIDLSEEYKRNVVDDMIERYKSGLTPNPDVLCNRYIKLGALWDFARKNGANFLATGHHARISTCGDIGCPHMLMRGVDAKKDQSYFLWQLTQEDLSHTIMPVGEMTKTQVRRYAEKHNLPVADKPDSQGLCFVGDVSMYDFLKEILHPKKGKVLSERGEVLGEHQGAELYTVGERRHFHIYKNKTNQKPMYVISTDISENTITVSEDITISYRKIATIINTNWNNNKPKENHIYKCQVRYGQEPQDCRIKIISEKEKAVIEFESSQMFAPGQSLVLYNEEKCLGGGILK